MPKALINLPPVRPYEMEDTIEFRTSGKHVILDFQFYEEGSSLWIEDDGRLSSLAGLRDNILRRDYRLLYLAQALLLEEEWDEAIEVAERREVWYTVIETETDAVIPHRPGWVARMSVKQAERLMSEAKSKHYLIAAAWLKKAKQAYVQLGQIHEWQAYLDKLKELYKPRPALQAQLRRI